MVYVGWIRAFQLWVLHEYAQPGDKYIHCCIDIHRLAHRNSSKLVYLYTCTACTHTHTLTVTTTELVTIPDNRQQELLAEFERRRKVRDLAVASLEQDRKIVFNISHFSDHQCCVIHNLFFCFSAQAKAIVVPTDDAEVKARLREQGEPICTHTQSHLPGGGCHHRA